MLHINPVFPADCDKITEVLHVIPIFDVDNQTVTMCATGNDSADFSIFFPSSWITELLHISDGNSLPDLFIQ